jgi:hypothetical protein
MILHTFSAALAALFCTGVALQAAQAEPAAQGAKPSIVLTRNFLRKNVT